jgi:predicted nucleic acid-binding protein
MPVLVDTNVLLDIVEDDPVWRAWSVEQLETASLADTLIVNAVIYAELSVAFDRIEDTDAVLAQIPASVAEIPREALFLAGKTYLSYRKRGGRKTGVLSDFFIGAHAAAAGIPLLTRDVGLYRTYFPTLQLIAPDG